MPSTPSVPAVATAKAQGSRSSAEPEPAPVDGTASKKPRLQTEPAVTADPAVPAGVGSRAAADIPKVATVIVVGAGPAGLGTAGLLEQCGIDTVVLERGEVGQTFKSWPKETKFISPSFTGNFFGCPDLNAITPESSPAFTGQTQHPTGEKYAGYLQEMKAHMRVDVVTHTEVTDVLVQKRETEAKSKDEACATEPGSKRSSGGKSSSGGTTTTTTTTAAAVPSGATVQQQLCAAAESGNAPAVRRLLAESAADPTAPGDNPVLLPMYFAAKGGHLDVATLLLEHGADVHVARTDCGATSLFMAAQKGHVAVCARLLVCRADPNQATTDDGQTPLFMAARQGHAAVAAMLLKHEANPNCSIADGRNPLYVAAGGGHSEVVELLLKHNADPTRAHPGDGSTPLFIAAAFGNADAAALLLKHSGTDPNQATTDTGATPLYIATKTGHGEVAAALLAHSKIEPNKATKTRETPLLLAARNGHVAIVEGLLQHSSTDSGLAGNDGNGPLYMAAGAGHEEIVAMLLKHGGADLGKKGKKQGKKGKRAPSQIDRAVDVARQEGRTAIVEMLQQTAADSGGATSAADAYLADLDSKRKRVPTITVQTSKGDYTAKFVVWAGGEFQYPRTIPHTIRVGHGTGYAAYADLPRGNQVVIGGSESGIDITHFLVGLGDTVTVLDASAPWGRRESDSSYGLSPYTFDRLRALQASGKVTFIAERADSITPTEIKTKSHTLQLTNPAIDATGFDISKSIAGKLFKFEDGVPKITKFDESTVSKNVFLVGPHVQHDGAVFCFIYKYRQRFAVVAKEIMARLGLTGGSKVLEEYAKKGFLLEDLTDCGNACPC